MPNTKTSICNMALGHLGISVALTDVDVDNTPHSLACLAFYDVALDEALSAAPWPFATKRAALAGAAAAPNPEWAFSYTYPSDAVALRRITQTGVRLDREYSRVPFQVAKVSSALVIYTSVAAAIVEYTERIVDEALYPAKFASVFSLLLGSRIGPRLMKGDQLTLADRAYKKYGEELALAIKEMADEERRYPEELDGTVEPIEAIANLALMNLGLDFEIQDLETEKSRPARVLRQYYNQTRDKVLRDFPWGFAKKTADLTAVADNPTDEWSKSYRYPSDCVRVRRIVTGNRHDTVAGRVEFTLAHDATGLLIYTDQIDAQLEYTARIDDPTLYTQDFKDAFGWALAYAAAEALLLNSKSKLLQIRTLGARYTRSLEQAQVNSANEEESGPEPESTFLTSRS